MSAQLDAILRIAAAHGRQMSRHYLQRAEAGEHRIEPYETDQGTTDIGGGIAVTMHMLTVIGTDGFRSIRAESNRLVIAGLNQEITNELLAYVPKDPNFGTYNQGLKGVLFLTYRFATTEHTDAINAILGPVAPPKPRRSVI